MPKAFAYSQPGLQLCEARCGSFGQAQMRAPEAGDMDAAEENVPQADCNCGASKSAVDLRMHRWLFRSAACNALSYAPCNAAAVQTIRSATAKILC